MKQIVTQEQRNAHNVAMGNIDPTIITVDRAAIDKQLAERRAAIDKANPPKTESFSDELGRLENWGDSLVTRLEGSEKSLNNRARRVKEFEQKIRDMQAFAATQHTPAQRVWAVKIADCQQDLVEAVRWLEAAKKINVVLLAEKKSFPYVRLQELRELVQEENRLMVSARNRVAP